MFCGLCYIRVCLRAARLIANDSRFIRMKHHASRYCFSSEVINIIRWLWTTEMDYISFSQISPLKVIHDDLPETDDKLQIRSHPCQGHKKPQNQNLATPANRDFHVKTVWLLHDDCPLQNDKFGELPDTRGWDL